MKNRNINTFHGVKFLGFFGLHLWFVSLKSLPFLGQQAKPTRARENAIKGRWILERDRRGKVQKEFQVQGKQVEKMMTHCGFQNLFHFGFFHQLSFTFLSLAILTWLFLFLLSFFLFFIYLFIHFHSPLYLFIYYFYFYFWFGCTIHSLWKNLRDYLVTIFKNNFWKLFYHVL